VALAAVVMVAGGCTSKTNGTASQAKPDKVIYVTSFGNFGRDAYVWVAKEKGYFKAANIDVQIEAGTGTNNVQEVASGKAQFTAVDFSGGIIQISKATSPLNIRAIAAIQQTSMAALMALPGAGISQPSDLVGKTIASTPGSVDQLLFPTYAKLAGFDPSKTKFVSGQATQLAQMLATHQVDAIDQFVVGQPSIQAVVKQQPVVLPFSKYIGDLYGNALWTSTSLIQSNPGLVKRFRDALMKGLTDALADPTGAGKILQKNVPTANPTSAAAELTLMKNYVESGGAVGNITSDRTAQMVAILQGSGAIPKAIAPNDLVDFNLVPTAQS
jgi:NitT/TauT family transport system substrate-binding protein